MTPIHNGPARNTPKGRTRRPLPALKVELDPTVCLCPNGRPIPIAHFADQKLVDVELRHLTSTGCGRSAVHVEPRIYQADIRR